VYVKCKFNENEKNIIVSMFAALGLSAAAQTVEDALNYGEKQVLWHSSHHRYG